MAEFLNDILKINNDGVLSINETIVIAIAVITVFILIIALKKPIMNFFNRVTPGRKKTIFSHRKNQYKTRIGKKSKASKKRN